MKQTIIVFDFETTHSNPTSELCDPVEVAAIAIHSKNLTVIEGSEFYLDIRPDGIDDPDYYTAHKATIDWHLGLPQNKGLKATDLIEKWKKGVPEKQAWGQFVSYINNYNYTSSFRSCPIPGGQNIKNFDLHIYNRLCEKHKAKPPFSKRDAVDTLELSFYWLAFNNDPPKSYKMDDLRPYFGISSEMGHNALVDVKQEAEIAIMYLKMFKKISQQTQFRNKLKAQGA